jgi:hypothetical protein
MVDARRVHRLVTRRVGLVSAAVTVLAAVAGMAGGYIEQAAAAATAPPRGLAAAHFSSPASVSSSDDLTTATAVNRDGDAAWLLYPYDPSNSGPSAPTLELAGPDRSVRTVHLRSTVPGYDHPVVAIADSGALVAAWESQDCADPQACEGPSRLEVAVGTFDAPPRTATILTPPGVDVSAGQAWITPSGTVFLLWEQATSDPNNPFESTYAAIVAPGSVPTTFLVADDTHLPPVGALDPQGNLVIFENGGERTVSTDGTIGPAEPLTGPVNETGQILFDAAGDQLFWGITYPSPGEPPSPQTLNLVWRAADGTFGPLQTFSYNSFHNTAQVALNTAGRAVALIPGPDGRTLSARFAARLGQFGAPHTVLGRGHTDENATLSMDGSGRTLIAWEESTRSTLTTRLMATVANQTTFAPPSRLTTQPGSIIDDAQTPTATADPAAAETILTYGISRVTHAAPLGGDPLAQLVYLRR